MALGVESTKVVHDLCDALTQPNCPICRMRTKSEDWFLECLLWESVNDPDTRRSVRQARGFCQEHSLGLVRIASAMGASLGVCIVTRDVLEELLMALENGKFDRLPSLSVRRVRETLSSDQPTASTAELVDSLEPQKACLACGQANEVERIYLKGFLAGLIDDGEFLAAYGASDGLCLPHFRQALGLVRGEHVFEVLVEAQKTIWQRHIAHLSESIRKHDWRFQDEAWGEETGAWLRAVGALVGERSGSGKPDR
jgi:hypothetical protein